MIFDELLKFLGQQNFALVRTNAPDAAILRNTDGRVVIFCVLLDNTGGNTWSASRVMTMNSRLSDFGGTINDVLFIVVTNDIQRDRVLSQIPQVRLWLADEYNRRLLIYENQPEDFYGLRFGIEETVAGQLYPDRDRPEKKYKGLIPEKLDNVPVVTIALILLNVIYFVIVATSGSLSDTSYMLKMGANYGVYVFERGQIWRIATSMFMHFSFSHLAGNMFYLGVAGYNLEKAAGRWRFLLIYMLSGIGAGIVSAGYYYLTGSNTISAGASGAVYGLIGAMVFVTYKNRGRMRSKQLFLRVGIMIVFLYYSNFTQSGVDGAAHIAGFIFGLVLSVMLLGTGKSKKTRK